MNRMFKFLAPTPALALALALAILAQTAPIQAQAATLRSQAHSVTNLKAVQVGGGGAEIQLQFDSKFARSQVTTEFFNDVIQLNLADTAVYPAKISSVNSADLTKIFAYQYAPKLVRCRLTVKGKAEDYKDRIVLVPNAKGLSVRILAPGQSAEASAQSSAQNPARISAKSSDKAAPSGRALEAMAPEERALLDRVIRSQSAPVAPNGQGAQAAQSEKPAPTAVSAPKQAKSAPAASTRAGKRAPVSDFESKPLSEPIRQPLATGKNPISPMSALIKILFVLGLFGVVALVLKRFAAGGLSASAGGRVGKKENGIMGALDRFARKNLNRKSRMIEVVTTHHLGPKKSIAVVRVAGRLLVLGVASDSISLITQLSTGAADSFTGIEDLEDLGIQVPGEPAENAPAIAEPRAAAPRTSRLTAAASAAAPDLFADLLSEKTGAVASPRASRPSIGAHNISAYSGSANTAGEPSFAMGQASQPDELGQIGQIAQPIAQAPRAQQPQHQNSAVAAAALSPTDSVRNKIRSRLEGLKPL